MTRPPCAALRPIAAMAAYLLLPALGAVSALFAADWPQWRGPHRDAIATEAGLLKEWPKDGPPLVWQIRGLGEGYSSVVIAGGRLFTLGDRDGNEYLIALDRSNGQELWATRVGEPWADGGPRCTPTVDGDRVYALSPHGDLVCVAAADGGELWRKNLKDDFGGRMMSGWGYSESPLVDGPKLICTPGGNDAALVALDKLTGDLVWKAPIPDAGGAGYASVVVAEVGGLRHYVTVLGKSGGLVGVAADDGRLLWRNNTVAGGVANVPTPVVQDDLVFYSTGYDDGGSALLRLVREGNGIQAQEVYKKGANEIRNHHGGVILIGKYLFGGHGQNQGNPFCLDFATGKPSWRERGPSGTSGSAAVVYADGHLYFRYENAVMALIEANPAGLKIKSTFKIPDGATPSWSHPVILDGQLYLRDKDRLLVYDVRDPKAKR